MFQQKSVTKYNFLKGTECCASLLPKVLSFQQSCSRDLHSWQSCGEETDLSSFRTWGEGDETLTTCKHLSAQTAHREHKCRPVCRAGRTACSSPQSYYWVQVWGHSETRPGVGPLLNSSLDLCIWVQLSDSHLVDHSAHSAQPDLTVSMRSHVTVTPRRISFLLPFLLHSNFQLPDQVKPWTLFYFHPCSFRSPAFYASHLLVIKYSHSLFSESPFHSNFVFWDSLM